MNPFRISLPATSANLGPGFDSVALALDLYLEISAEAAATYSIEATGRNAEQCSNLRRNLVLSVYEETVRGQGKEPHPLRISVTNGIPIGMGCGSSAAARLAGLALANHFGALCWTPDRILEEACRLEGHQDNAAACWLGGFTVAAGEGKAVRAVAIDPPTGWTAILVLPDQPLSTTVARAILPSSYSRADAVANVQNVALLTAAFHSRRPDLLQFAMADRFHQPYRGEVCVLLPLLLPLAGQGGILGVALSGAGPAVLVLVGHPSHAANAIGEIRRRLQAGSPVETLTVPLAPTRRHHSA
jgi:homoserine kinase